MRRQQMMDQALLEEAAEAQKNLHKRQVEEVMTWPELNKIEHKVKNETSMIVR